MTFTKREMAKLKQSVISFGPSCISAEILKACDLREKTYGFDWFRSGSIHHKLFFEMNINEYVASVVMKPSIFLQQKTKLCETEHKTTEVVKKKILYGYDVLYNPHRDYNKSSREYFNRAFQRIDIRLKQCKDIPRPTLLMSDYTNKKHYVYFKYPITAANYLKNNVLIKYGYEAKIIIIRFKLVSKETWTSEDAVIDEKGNIRICTIPIWDKIDDSVEHRRTFYKSLRSLLIY